MSEKIKEILEFPVMYTFKAMGENSQDFISCVKEIFIDKQVDSFTEKPSSKGNYIAVSITCEVIDYDELESLYSSIMNVRGIKFYL